MSLLIELFGLFVMQLLICNMCCMCLSVLLLPVDACVVLRACVGVVLVFSLN